MAGKRWVVPTPGNSIPKLPPIKLETDFDSGGSGAAVSVAGKGFKSLEDMLKEMPKVAVAAALKEYSKIAAEVIEDSREHYVPYKDGYLRDSAGWDEYTSGMEANALTEIRMWFGAPLESGSGVVLNTETIKRSRAHAKEAGAKFIDPSQYALDQHENIYHHPVVGPVTNPQHKYLEKPFLAKEPTILGRLAAKISEAWGGTVSADAIISEAEGITALDPIMDRLGNMTSYPGYGAK